MTEDIDFEEEMLFVDENAIPQNIHIDFGIGESNEKRVPTHREYNI